MLRRSAFTAVLALACASPKIESNGGGDVDAAIAGGDHDAAAVTAPPGRAHLEVTPDNDVLLIDRGQTATRSFAVKLVRADGGAMDVTARAKLTLDNAQAGALSGA